MALEFSAQSKQQIERLLTRYPNKQAALLPVLHVAQDEFGYLPDEVVDLVARTLDLPHAHIHGVVTFYTMFHRKRHGANELMVCTNISCMLRGGYDVLHHIEKRLGIKPGETTPDGAFTLVEEECLAACANAPMMICGTEYFLDLTTQKVDTVLDDLKKRYEERKRTGPTAAKSPSPLPARAPTPAPGVPTRAATPLPGAPARSPTPIPGKPAEPNKKD
jgi:NADH-quinone oxidoreductase E subunit